MRSHSLGRKNTFSSSTLHGLAAQSSQSSRSADTAVQKQPHMPGPASRPGASCCKADIPSFLPRRLLPATAGTAARHPCHNFPCIIQVFPIPRRINTATPKKDGPRTLAEAVPPMYLFLIFLFLLTLWFPVHRNNMIAVRASGLCLHWLRGFRADIHDTLSAPWAFQSLHSCPPPRIQPRFLAAGALTWRLSHCLPPVKFLSTLSRQESLLPHVPPSISSVLSQTRPNRRPCL